MTAAPDAPTAVEVGWGQTWPRLGEFRDLATARRVIPVVRRLLADELTPVGVYRALAGGRPGTFILESAAADGSWDRYSFVGVRSRATLTARDGRAVWLGDVPVGVPTEGDPIEVLGATLEALRTTAIPGLPPFTGGLVGALGWDVIRYWEPTLVPTSPDELGIPELALCLASDLIVVDHHEGAVWLIANAINFDDTDARVDEAHADAVARLDTLERGLAAARAGAPLTLGDAPEPAVDHRSTQEEYEAIVEQGKREIRDGEVFQVVLSQRFDLDCPADPIDVYRVLRTLNPSPYMYCVTLEAPDGAFSVVGSSPETLVKVEGRRVMSFPIAGSRPRGKDAVQDAELTAELLADPKELAEHLMLVDLARNDLAKVSDPATVRVVEFMDVRRFSHIMHICSTVTGELRPDATALETLTATFPAGTLSGAPKPRAVQLIDELEPARRGIYGGTVGYFDFDGNMDMAIAIRTALIRGRTASVQAGGGIVADSVPTSEYEESRNKAAAAIRAVQLAARLRPAGTP
ncbi:anthranilate synthase component I [Beutenbergia cavernae DSM 12333]|uniref:Anthranilate synthase component 1 n=1 Tax=Beutenbergia cavernae (strain ATCC BAA-8 / DSM 12333 / CCUG 43141 / JCM 11478 / NBRC 16432 / NCIMB 13614 / HKI 0122) TaxID=471853 RepID=C5BV91_BEUC1|nr:anthranilate synthase component I [Beutenbergia cavernae]ACQ80478.1 anthranilate synthase component I [Beutenbergia cavernae DSM 12333]